MVNGAFFPKHSGITSQVQGLKNGWMGDYVYVITVCFWLSLWVSVVLQSNYPIHECFILKSSLYVGMHNG